MKKELDKQDNNKSGVYKITNIINGKFYLGCTKNFSRRYRAHLYTLTHKISGCIILQNAVNKYGLENFVFSIIEICDNYKQREIELFQELVPKYNAIIETKIRRDVSLETKKKMSDAMKLRYEINPPKRGYKRTDYIRVKKSNVIIHDDITILKFDSIQEAADYFNCSVQAIYQNFKRNTLLKHKYKVNIIN